MLGKTKLQDNIKVSHLQYILILETLIIKMNNYEYKSEQKISMGKNYYKQIFQRYKWNFFGFTENEYADHDYWIFIYRG